MGTTPHIKVNQEANGVCKCLLGSETLITNKVIPNMMNPSIHLLNFCFIYKYTENETSFINMYV